MRSLTTTLRGGWTLTGILKIVNVKQDPTEHLTFHLTNRKNQRFTIMEFWGNRTLCHPDGTALSTNSTDEANRILAGWRVPALGRLHAAFAEAEMREAQEPEDPMTVMLGGEGAWI